MWLPIALVPIFYGTLQFSQGIHVCKKTFTCQRGERLTCLIYFYQNYCNKLVLKWGTTCYMRKESNVWFAGPEPRTVQLIQLVQLWSPAISFFSECECHAASNSCFKSWVKCISFPPPNWYIYISIYLSIFARVPYLPNFCLLGCGCVHPTQVSSGRDARHAVGEKNYCRVKWLVASTDIIWTPNFFLEQNVTPKRPDSILGGVG